MAMPMENLAPVKERVKEMRVKVGIVDLVVGKEGQTVGKESQVKELVKALMEVNRNQGRLRLEVADLSLRLEATNHPLLYQRPHSSSGTTHKIHQKMVTTSMTSTETILNPSTSYNPN